MHRRLSLLLAAVFLVAGCSIGSPNRDRLSGTLIIPAPESVANLRSYLAAVAAGDSADEIWAKLPQRVRDTRAQNRWVATTPAKAFTTAEKSAIAKLIAAGGGKMLPAASGRWLSFTGSSKVAYAVLKRASINRVIPDFKVTLDPIEKANAAARVTVDGLAVRPATWNPGQKPNDVYLDELWGMKAIDAAGAWKKSTGKNVVVAVIDTGLDASHPDLRGAQYVNGYDFIVGLPLYAAYKDDWMESVSIPHGTHVAGTIAAVANNGYGVVGVAPNVKLMPVRVLDEGGSGYLSDVAAGIEWAANKGAKVANLSLGGVGYGIADYAYLADIFGPSIGLAMTKGMAVVVASGNDGFNEGYEAYTTWPAADPRVIRVAAFGDDSEAPGNYSSAYFSTAAPNVTVTAPGMSVLSTYSPRGYGRWDGTSMATPHVTGVVALMKSLNAALTPAQLRAYLRMGAIDTDESFGDWAAPGVDAASGAGRLSASGSVNAAAAKRAVMDIASADPRFPHISPAGGYALTMSTNAPSAKCIVTASLYQTPAESSAYYPPLGWGFPGTEEYPRVLVSEAPLSGTTCGTRAVTLESLDVAFAAAGQDPMPSDAGNLSVVFTVRAGTLNATTAPIPVLPPDEAAPTIVSDTAVGGPYSIDYVRTMQVDDPYTLDPIDSSMDVAMATDWSDDSSTSVASLAALLDGACDDPINVLVFEVCDMSYMMNGRAPAVVDLLGGADSSNPGNGSYSTKLYLTRYDLNDLPKWAKVFATTSSSEYSYAFLKSLYAGVDPVSVKLAFTFADASGNSVSQNLAEADAIALMTQVYFAEGNPEDVVWKAASCEIAYDYNDCDNAYQTYSAPTEGGLWLLPPDLPSYFSYDALDEVETRAVYNSIGISTFTYTGTGNELALSALRGDAFDGTISIAIDGVFAELIDLTGDGSGIDTLVFETYAVDPGEHTVVITTSGTVNLNSIRIGDSPLP